MLLHPVGHLLKHLQDDRDPQEKHHAGIILTPTVLQVRPFTLRERVGTGEINGITDWLRAGHQNILAK